MPYNGSVKDKSKLETSAVANQEPLKPTPELERLIRERFTPEGKAQRVDRSLSALRSFEPFAISTEKLRFLAEDPDLEEQ